MRAKHPNLRWTETTRVDKYHSWYVAEGADGTVYRIKPVNYRSGKFAGYRVRAGSVWIRGWKPTLHEAKASA